ncbi:MAG TPA: hypothetical protein VG817_12035 [Gemmatimonadales bacterium]|nr:hypothetical protein [Gemmatimonadales bacterium]
MSPFLLWLLVQAPVPDVPPVHIVSYQVQAAGEEGAWHFTIEADLRGAGAVDFPLPDAAPDTVELDLPPGAVAMRPGHQPVLHLVVQDSLTRVVVKWKVSTARRERFRLANISAAAIDDFRVTYRLPPGMAPRAVESGGGTSQPELRLRTGGTARTAGLRQTSLPPREAVTVSFTLASQRKSLMPLLIGTLLAGLYLFRRRELLHRDGTEAT